MPCAPSASRRAWPSSPAQAVAPATSGGAEAATVAAAAQPVAKKWTMSAPMGS